jgi:N-acetyl-D-muramate 6-phosphate phosphatase
MTMNSWPLLHTKAPFKAVLFDLDGTLLDSAPDLAAAANAMLVHRGQAKKPVALYRDQCGYGVRSLLSIAFGKLPNEANYEAMCEEFLSYYAKEMIKSPKLFTGIKEILASLERAAIPWGIVTNKNQRLTNPLVAQIAEFTHAKVVISGDTTAHAKPHPEPLYEAARCLSIAPEQCIYVGDGERDIQAGKAANMHTIAVTYGYISHPNDAQTWQADRIAHTQNELREILLGQT